MILFCCSPINTNLTAKVNPINSISLVQVASFYTATETSFTITATGWYILTAYTSSNGVAEASINGITQRMEGSYAQATIGPMCLRADTTVTIRCVFSGSDGFARLYSVG